VRVQRLYIDPEQLLHFLRREKFARILARRLVFRLAFNPSINPNASSGARNFTWRYCAALSAEASTFRAAVSTFFCEEVRITASKPAARHF
jgi:hypothetical protein